MDLPRIRLAQDSDREELAEMFAALWPENSATEYLREIDPMLRGTASALPLGVLVSLDPASVLTGFLEVGLRSHADGCDPARSVGFIEGWFVKEPFRRQGVGLALMRAAESWAREHGCREMASDALIDNGESQRAHAALGFKVVDRCVHFRKAL